MIALFIIIGNGLLALLAEIFKFQKFIFNITFVLLLAALASNYWAWQHPQAFAPFSNMICFNMLELVLSSLLIAATILWLFIQRASHNHQTFGTDLSSLILFALAGGLLLTAFQNLTTLFIGVELLSIPLYVLAASHKNSADSHEAGFKYLILGAFASALLLFGIALLYGGAASFDINAIQAYLNAQANLPAFVKMGMLLLLIAFCFKVAIAPFHFWSPDVYEGAPMAITAFMSTVAKTASFYAFFKITMVCFNAPHTFWISMLMAFAVLSLILANTSALGQKHLKRLFAYSGISHSAFLLLIIIAQQKQALSVNALIMYTASYMLSGLGAFAILVKHGDVISDYAGFAKRNPTSAFSFSVCLLSMAGIPITAGFFSKYMVFVLLLSSSVSIWVSVIAIVAALIGIYYYIRLITQLYSKTAEEPQGSTQTDNNWIALLCAIALLVIGFFPQSLGGIFTF
jgi:NADH-quinone oxidoreductase subunit N